MFCFACATANGWTPTWNVDFGACDHCGKRSHCTTDTPVVKVEQMSAGVATDIKAIFGVTL